MFIALTGQANIVSLPIAAKASANPITAGTVNFYLQAKDGDNAGKWYKGDGGTWEESESVAGAASHVGDGHWSLSLPSAVWTDGVGYLLYGKESGDLHVPVSTDVRAETPILEQVGVTVGGTWTTAKLLQVMAAWMMGKWQDKSGVAGTYEVLDPDDETTVVVEVVPQASTPQKTVTILI